MKAVLLFSAIFYLIGLKIGTTVESVLRSLIPARTTIEAPYSKSENRGDKEKTLDLTGKFGSNTEENTPATTRDTGNSERKTETKAEGIKK
jgi:hypothetical protein